MNRFITCMFLLAVAVLCAATPTQAAFFSWAVAGPDDMSIASNWNPTLVTPFVAGDRLYINNGGVAVMNTDIGDATNNADYLYAGWLSGTDTYSGTIGKGTVNQEGGTLYLGGGIRGIGRDNGTGVYNLNAGSMLLVLRSGVSGGLLVGENETIGTASGTLNMGTGTSITLGSAAISGGGVNIGNGGTTAGGGGKVTMGDYAAITVYSSNVNVGTNGGRGELSMGNYSTITQNGGDFYVGANSGSIGTMTFGNAISYGAAVIKNGGGNFIIGQGAGTTGTVDMTNASMTGNAVNNRNVSWVGKDSGTGTLNMTSSTWDTAEILVGQNLGTGTLHLTDATLTLNTSPDWTTEWWYGYEASLDVGRWGGTGHMVADGASFINVMGRTMIGNGTNAGGNGNIGNPGGIVSHGDLTLAGSTVMTTSTGTMRNYGWVWNDGGDVYVGTARYYDYGSDGGVGTLTIKDSATINTGGELRIGENKGIGTLDYTSSNVSNIGNHMRVGYDAGNGTANLSSGGLFMPGWLQIGQNDDNRPDPTVGVFNMSGGSIDMASGGGIFTVGWGPLATGTLNMTGGTITSRGWDIGNAAPTAVGTANIGPSGVITNSSGWFDVGANTGTGTMNTSGSITNTSLIFIGRQGANGTWNQNGGLTNDSGGTYLGEVWRNGDAWYYPNATLNLNGGNYATPWIQHWDNAKVGGTQTIKFNGGALEAQVDTGDFIIDQVSIGTGGTKVFVSGGATFNTADTTAVAHFVQVNLPLQHDPSGPAIDGGLTKVGAGTLALTASSSLNGPVAVNQGTLNLTRSASLAATSVTVAGGTTLSLGSASNLGALNALNLQSGSTLGVSLTPTLAGNAISVAAGGVANTNGVNYVVNAEGSSLALGVYPIVTSSAIPLGTAGTVTTNMRAYTATAVVNGAQTEVDIVVAAGSDTAKNLTWNPVSATPYPWDIKTTTNWTGAADNLFWNLDSVTFDNTLLSTTQSTVNVVGTVHPSAITIVAPGATTPWLFQGNGAITGVDTPLTLTGPGKATFNNLGGIDITGPITLQGGGTFETGAGLGPTTLIGNVALSGGSIISVAGRPLTLPGVISDDGTSGLIKAGGGRLVIANNANTYAGPTKISGGYLVINTLTDAGAGGTPSSLGVASNAGANLNFNGGFLHYTGPSTTVDRSFIVTAGGSGIRIDNDLTLPANIDANSGATIGDLTKTGPGTLTFANPTSHVNTLANLFLVSEGPAVISSGIYQTTDWMDVGTRGYHASFAMTGTSQLHVATSLNMGGYGNGAMEAMMTGSTAITVGTWFSVGRESNSVGTLTMGTLGGTDNPTITVASWANVGCWNETTGTLIMNANSKLILNTLADGNWTNFGYANSSHANVTLNDNAQINGMGNGGLSFSAFDSSSATVSLHNFAQITQAAPGQILFGDSYGTCVVDLYDDSKVIGGGSVYVGVRNNDAGDVGYGSLTLHNNSRLNAATLIVGDEGSDGNLNVNDTAQVQSAGDILLGQEWGNAPTALGPGGKVNVNSATASVTAGGSVIVGANGGIGIYTQNAGTTTSTARAIVGEWDYWDSGTVANQTPGNGTLNLNGGVFVAPQVTTNSDPAGAGGVQGTVGVINFNGGVLKASAASAAFITTDQTAGHAASTMTLNVLAGGAKIDSNGFDVSIALPLAHAGAGTDGGLEKEGLGTLTLTGPISYNGPTLIDAGRLSIDNGLTTTLGTVSGAGWFAVGASNPATVVNATSIEVGTLSIGSGFFAAAAVSSEISQPSQASYVNGKSLVGSPVMLNGVTPVPEPGTLTLLVLAGLALAGAYFRRK